MYFVSGWVMIMEGTFPRETVEEIKDVKVIPAIKNANNTELIVLLKDHFGVNGQYEIRVNERQKSVRFFHPGINSETMIPNNTDSVTTTIRKGNGITILQGFHRLHGYKSGWNYYLWAFMYDLSSLSIIVFTLTGFYLWYKTESNHLTGWLIFGAFSLFTAFIVFYLMILS